MHDRGVPNARNLHSGPHVLQAGGTLLALHQGIHSYHKTSVQCAGKGSQDGPHTATSGGAGSSEDPEGQDSVCPMLVFLDLDKPFLLETDASKEGLGSVLSQKQDDGHYHPVTFENCSLMPAEKNYHSLKLEFLTLKWGVMEHFKEYLAYVLFVVRTDNNPLMYVLTTPNINAIGYRWVGMLASFQFALEYQKGADNGAADALS